MPMPDLPPRDFDTAAAKRAVEQIGSKRRHWLARLSYLSGARWGAQNLAEQVNALIAQVDDSQIGADECIDALTGLIDQYLHIAATKEADHA